MFILSPALPRGEGEAGESELKNNFRALIKLGTLSKLI
ncbi:hypothetical protein CAPSP0001_2095 [Capnocytophaga sputigena ATCC 33612]|nr:hypothetical protein CAPSP0001_2095 [Capnocytophaga sputigena ATCC 33612]